MLNFQDNPAYVTLLFKSGLSYRVPISLDALDKFIDGINLGQRVTSFRPVPAPDGSDSSQFVNTCWIDGRDVSCVLVEYPPDHILYDLLEELEDGSPEEN